jgi:NTE family protein
LPRLREFWRRVEQDSPFGYYATLAGGIPALFAPRPMTWGANTQTRVGLDAASWYDTAPLRNTLSELVDVRILNEAKTRLTVGAVRVRTSEMRYFDSREQPLGLEHIMARARCRPRFPAIRIEGEPYWDGGIYSNTPVEGGARRPSSARLGDLRGQRVAADRPEPQSVWQVPRAAEGHPLREPRRQPNQAAEADPSPAARDSRAGSTSSDRQEDDKECEELASWGCATVMHVARLLAPALASEDYFKDIDFSRDGIRASVAGRDPRHAAHARARTLGRPGRPDGGRDRARAFQAHRRGRRADRLKNRVRPRFFLVLP